MADRDPRQPGTTFPPPDEALSPRERLGIETDAERVARRVVPWIISASLHALLIVAGFLITWTVILRSDAGQPSLAVADHHVVLHEPVVSLDPVQQPADEAAPSPLETSPVVDVLEQQPLDQESELLELVPPAGSAATAADFAPPQPRGSASFMGLATDEAQRIVYVIDASGSMIAYLQTILQELVRSLDALTAEQEFAIVFFQGNEALPVPPARLEPATDRARQRALDWIESNIIPRGRSNPLAAIETALRMNPDAIFILSDNITGSGIFEIDQRDLFRRLDQLNPRDRLTGNRRTTINCIQFLDPDPLDTLRLIAEEHGGPRGYRFISRAELGLAQP